MALYGIIAFVIYGWVEAMAHVVDAIGGLLAFLGIFLTAIIGIRLLRSQSAIVMASFRQLSQRPNEQHSHCQLLIIALRRFAHVDSRLCHRCHGFIMLCAWHKRNYWRFLATRLNARTMAGMSSPLPKGFHNRASRKGFLKRRAFRRQFFNGISHI